MGHLIGSSLSAPKVAYPRRSPHSIYEAATGKPVAVILRPGKMSTPERRCIGGPE
jgi:hypothetical protein